MRQKLFLFTLVFSLSSMVYAQQPGDQSTQVKDPEAKKILDRLSAKTNQYTTVYAKFDYNLKNKDAGLDETMKGEVTIKGDQYRLKMAGQEIISDGEKLYTYIEDVKELQISYVEDNEDASAFSPSELFTLYEKGFKYKYEGTATKDGQSVDVIKLYPEKADKPYHTVILYILKGTPQIHAMEVKGKDGNTYTYTITEFDPNKTVSASTFSFDQSKADDVIDFTE